MRKIKFRAYNPIAKAMFEVDGIDLKKKSLLRIERNPWNVDVLDGWTNKDNYKLMQFTGLRDKNEKEIYEGDIIVNFYIHFEHDGVGFEVVCDKSEYKNKACSHKKVIYADDSAMFIGSGGGEMVLGQAHMTKWVIIGNIYENPELLK